MPTDTEAPDAIVAAQALIQSLTQQRQSLIAHKRELQQSRASKSFQAHAERNPHSKTELEKIQETLLRIDLDIESLDEALQEANHRLLQASQARDANLQRELAIITLAKLQKMEAMATELDNLLRSYVSGISQLKELTQEIMAVAGRPTTDQWLSAVKRGTLSHLTSLHTILNTELLHPRDRHELAFWVRAWSVNVNDILNQRLEQFSLPVPAAAE